MGKRLPTTPRSRVRAALRQLWLRSRERAAAIKRDKYTCQMCNRKQSKAKGKEFKVEVHHLDGVRWEQMVDIVYEMLLCDPQNLLTVCEDCHDQLKEKVIKEKAINDGLR
ncbi:MAG: HNH endonuclease signature motif containing protein, partial [Syntrophorhabdaceae bacterium]|nr:HNH endonuclease signature motif containing protein [Syntrophorhabdaceae bacterium]